MKFLNCNLNEACKILKRKRIIFFGCGSWLNTINFSKLMDLKDDFEFVVDNNPASPVWLGEKRLEVYSPEVLRTEADCIIILTSPVYMYDMYCQLEDMCLDDSIHCYAFPFMQMISRNELPVSLMDKVTPCTEHKIPKIIHCFWFSGEEKPKSYQCCMDTWGEHLRDYNIIEWNQSNYDCQKHKFLAQAIKCGAWAFASDYARLDVLNEYGGIYLDMDVEVYKPFDSLLGNEALFSYSNNVQIDLAVLGAAPHNKIVRQLLRVYDEIPVPKDREGFSKCFQPTLVKPALAKCGVSMDGSLQIIDGATIFPSDFFMPQEHILFKPFVKTEHTYCNHLDNFGWSFGKENKREKKIKDNNKLWSKLKDKE